jgi:hypothetical protein
MVIPSSRTHKRGSLSHTSRLSVHTHTHSQIRTHRKLDQERAQNEELRRILEANPVKEGQQSSDQGKGGPKSLSAQAKIAALEKEMQLAVAEKNALKDRCTALEKQVCVCMCVCVCVCTCVHTCACMYVGQEPASLSLCLCLDLNGTTSQGHVTRDAKARASDGST